MQSIPLSSPNLKVRQPLRTRELNGVVRRSIFVLILTILIVSNGCRIFRRCNHVQLSTPTTLQKSELPAVPLNEIAAIKIPFVEGEERGKIPSGFDQVYPLTLEDCERLAANYSPISAVLEAETSSHGPCQPCSQVDPCVRDAINSIVVANSSYQRNLAAERAMLAYLGLAEVYLQNQIAVETIAEIEELQSVLKKLQEEGLLRNVDPESLERKRLEAIEQQNELLFNFEKLNENLRALLGLEQKVHPIWTDCQIPSWQIPGNLSNELEVAMENRRDLQSLQRLSTISNDQILDTLRSSVRSVNPLAGLVLERRLFGGFFADNSAEISKLRSQLMILQSAQSDLARSTVSEYFYSVFKHHELIQLKIQKLESLRKSEARIEAKRQVGPIEVDEVLSVKSDTLKCRSEIIHSAIELQMAWIKLKSAQGLLGSVQQQGSHQGAFNAPANSGNYRKKNDVPRTQPNSRKIPGPSNSIEQISFSRKQPRNTKRPNRSSSAMESLRTTQLRSVPYLSGPLNR